jgi:hypothetical protein
MKKISYLQVGIFNKIGSAAGNTGGTNLVKLSAGLVTGLAVFLFVAASGIKLGCREGDTTEHFTGIFGAAGIFTAFLIGDAVIQYGNYQLCIPLQPNNRELPQSDKKSSSFAGKHQLFIKHSPYPIGDLHHCFAAGAFTDILHLGTKNHRIQYFHDCCR